MAQLEGLLNNPALQMGLGILANNNSSNFGQVIGRGGLTGMRNLQQQNMMSLRQQQMDMMNKMRAAQMKEIERQNQQRQQQAQAGAKFKEEFPQYANAYDISPSQAMEMAYPQSSSAQPYYQAVPTPQGIGRFNARTGEMEIITDGNGKPFVKSSDSPELQGRLAGSKARAEADYKLDDSVDGNIATVTQRSDQARGVSQNWGVSPQLQSERDSKRLAILENEQAQAGGAGNNPALDREIQLERQKQGVVGIPVPTKAEQAAAVEAAKTEVKYNSPESVEKRNKAIEFKRTMGQNVVKKIDDLIGRVDGFSSGWTGKQLSNISGTDAYDLNADIETVKANFGFDRLQAMRDMSPTGGALGQVAIQELTALQASIANMDIGQSTDQLKKNLETAKSHYENWLNTLDDGSKSQQSSSIGTGDFSVTAPNGKTYRFSTQRDLNNFKMKAKIR